MVLRSPCNGAKGCPYAPIPVIRWAKDEHGKKAVLSFAKNTKIFRKNKFRMSNKGWVPNLKYPLKVT